MLRSLLAAAALLLPAAASAQGIAGQWQCSYGNRGPDMYNTWQYQFVLALNPDGSFQAQGSYTAASAGFAVPFQAQGQWRGGAGGVQMQGVAMKQGGQIAFAPSFNNVGPRAMSFRYSSPRGQLSTYCQR